MKYKVIKKYEVSYLPNDIFKGQEHIPLTDVKGERISLKLDIDDIIEFSDDKDNKWVKINGEILDKKEIIPEIQSVDYYLKNAFIEHL